MTENKITLTIDIPQHIQPVPNSPRTPPVKRTVSQCPNIKLEHREAKRRRRQ